VVTKTKYGGLKMNELSTLNPTEKMFVLGLILSVTAPDAFKSRECIRMAESLSHEFSEEQIEKLKTLAEKRLAMQDPFDGLLDSIPTIQ